MRKSLRQHEGIVTSASRHRRHYGTTRKSQLWWLPWLRRRHWRRSIDSNARCVSDENGTYIETNKSKVFYERPAQYDVIILPIFTRVCCAACLSCSLPARIPPEGVHQMCCVFAGAHKKRPRRNKAIDLQSDHKPYTHVHTPMSPTARFA